RPTISIPWFDENYQELNNCLVRTCLNLKINLNSPPFKGAVASASVEKQESRWLKITETKFNSTSLIF
ncbi:hypothetical protein, partial [Gelidibacter japonicus]|uniref:hypothetical protein n=1 Tax=Gelidibacter japonicus TaxID=1962232 RepID=UPI003A922006